MKEKPDFTYFNSVTGGDYNTMLEFIDIFKEQLPEFVKNFYDAIDHNDYKAVAYTAHKATSTVSIFGMTSWINKLKEIQNEIQNGVIPSNLKKIISDFENDSKEVIEFALQYVHGLK